MTETEGREEKEKYGGDARGEEYRAADKLNRKLDFPSGLHADASMAKLSAGC